MKRILTLLKTYKLLIIGLILGILTSVISVYYADPIYFAGENVLYNNQTSGMNSSNVKEAIDELAAKAYENRIIEQLAAADGTTPGITSTGNYDTTCYSSYTCSSRSINYSYSTTGNFEISFDSLVYDQTAAFMGGYHIVFKDGSNIVIDFANNDEWAGENKMKASLSINGTQVWSENATSGTGLQGMSKFRLVRQGSTLTIYRDGVSKGTTTLSGTFNVTNIETQFLKYGSNITVPSMISNIYVGPIRS